MGRLSCSCLNVSVHYKDKSWSSRAVRASVLLPEGSKDKLVGQELFEIELDVAGATAEHKCLVTARTAGDWVIHTCTNCNTDSYILHAIKDTGRTFVTGKLLSNPAAMQKTTRQEGYSQVFRIILSEGSEDDEEMMSRKRISSMSFGREDPVMKGIHSQMKSYLNGQQEAMEERIARFEEQERAAFAQLQQKAHRERALLFTAIGQARQNIISDAMTEQSVEAKPLRPPSHPHTTSPPKHTPAKPHPLPEQQNVAVTLNNPTFPNIQPVPVKEQVAGDTVFSLDGFDEDCIYDEPDMGVVGGVAFPQSDDEEISTDDSSYRDVSALQGIASSVPVGVPMFARRVSDASANYSPSDGFQLEDVGNSIKALALSVQDTGMFGDLPRPRIRSYARYN